MVHYYLKINPRFINNNTGEQRKWDSILQKKPDDLDPEEFKEWTLEQGLIYGVTAEYPISKTFQNAIQNLHNKLGISNPDNVVCFVNGRVVEWEEIWSARIGRNLQELDLPGPEAYCLTYNIDFHRT